MSRGATFEGNHRFNAGMINQALEAGLTLIPLSNDGRTLLKWKNEQTGHIASDTGREVDIRNDTRLNPNSEGHSVNWNVNTHGEINRFGFVPCRNKMIVFDCDGVFGVGVFRDWFRSMGLRFISGGLRVVSPGGGVHIYYRMPAYGREL